MRSKRWNRNNKKIVELSIPVLRTPSFSCIAFCLAPGLEWICACTTSQNIKSFRTSAVSVEKPTKTVLVSESKAAHSKVKVRAKTSSASTLAFPCTFHEGKGKVHHELGCCTRFFGYYIQFSICYLVISFQVLFLDRCPDWARQYVTIKFVY